MEPPYANNHHYNKYLRSNANKLRKGMTKAEACLWKYVLRAGGVKGFTFRRQRPVLKYIADFMCKELSLIVEVDGITHTYEEVIKKDKIRQRDLENAGFTVIRFDDDDVLRNINWVNEEIEDQVTRLMALKGVSPRTRRRRSKEE
ncbi:MAG: endonuclease domain-containing protein [Bacteroidota bacterium]